MIETAIRLIASELDQSLRRRGQGGPQPIIVSNLVDSGGGAVPDTIDKVAVFLVNIEREVVPARGLRPIDRGADRIGLTPAPVYLNLLVMFAANYSGSTYGEALKVIASTIAFFQGRPVFTHANTPTLDDGIEQLTIEIENLNTTDLSNLWGIIGGRYLPSVLYRVRMIAIDSEQLETQPRRVETTTATVAPAGVASS
jgi:hypothetical protein